MSSRLDKPEDILLVDDSAENLRLLTQILSGQGYEVRAVTSGQRALASALVEPPSLILLDIRMPEMDGYQVCRELKGCEATENIPVIFISALQDLQDKVDGFAAGGVDFVTKPFQPQEVLARVEAHLTLQRLQRELVLANRRYEQELKLAGDLQISFLPPAPPQIAGYQIALTLKPARETSGDFYDVFPLPNGAVGLLIADVVDKGAAAALFMALSLTLLRDQAVEHPLDPARVLREVNRRLIAGTDGNRFVTVFYGSLDVGSGRLTYSNAGHNPPLLARAASRESPTYLSRTGPLLGMLPEQAWQTSTTTLEPGDALVLYTDGITEAQGSAGDLYGMERLEAVVREACLRSACEVQEHILASVQGFLGDAPQWDDIALMVLRRDQV